MFRLLMLSMFLLMVCGCDGFRYPASQAQKQNAWLHLRTTQLTADTAKTEQASDQLRSLADLACEQSQAFVADYGVPNELPPAGDVQTILAGSGMQIAKQAQLDGSRRIDPWTAADGVMELGIGLAGLLGGAWGIRAAGFFKQARDKSIALKEIITGNEVLKQANSKITDSFKQAHKNQSPATKQIVNQVKNQ